MRLPLVLRWYRSHWAPRPYWLRRPPLVTISSTGAPQRWRVVCGWGPLEVRIR